MSFIKQLIYETVRDAINGSILNEGLSSILYHYTSIRNGYSICKSDTIYLQSAYSKDADNYDGKRKYYLSCTRLFGSQFGYARKFSMGGVRLVLDGDKLAQNFKGKPINYWNGLNDKYYYYKNLPKNSEELQQSLSWSVERFKKKNPDATPQDIQHFIDYNFNTDAQGHLDNETEDRILSYEPVINNAHQYIISVDVLIPDLQEDNEKRKLAYSFVTKTPLAGKIKIFDSVKQFNSPKGKSLTYEEIRGENYFDNTYDIDNESNPRKAVNSLNSVIQFIAYANPKFEGNKFGSEVEKLLQKYELTNFSKEIGNFMINRKRIWSAQQAAEQLDSVRRNLSDNPNRNNSNILRMMSDYLIEIGANSFRQGYLIKKQMEEEYYGRNNNVYDRIDTNVKKNFLILNKYGIILNPSKELFYDALRYGLNWSNETIQQTADGIANDIFDNYDGNFNYNTNRTKNSNSMFQYIFKLFRKGTVAQVLETLSKMGVNNEYLANWGIEFDDKQLDYWEASNYDTINTLKYKGNSINYDYQKLHKMNNKEIEQSFPLKNKD